MADRERIIKGLEHCINEEDCEGCVYYDDYYNKMKEQHSGNKCLCFSDAVALLKEYGWISVNDRLPNCNGCYLVWRPRFYGDKGMPSICYFDGQNTWHDSYGVDFTRILKPEDVSHWKPLPEQL